jgi:uncharacterized protein (TIGR00375 family)
MFYTADLHTHSHYATATSKDLTLESMYQWAQVKGINVMGTGDFTHPGWIKELKEKLYPIGNGFYKLKSVPSTPAMQGLRTSYTDTQFCLATEISCEYVCGNKPRKIHHLVYVPDFEAADAFNDRLSLHTDLSKDGRPTISISSHDLLEIVLQTSDRAYLVPAHAWTPWNAMLGSIYGHDCLEGCFRDLSPHIFALETGLSSDPLMNWRWSKLDHLTMMSNSDAHSPRKLGREANLFDTELSYDAMFDAVKTGKGFKGTYEFFPEEGKYSNDGHRDCHISFDWKETQSHKGICPVCYKPLTIGVMHRVELLADRITAQQPHRAPGFHYIVPLTEILSEIYRVGEDSKKVNNAFVKAISFFGNEFTLLKETPIEDIQRYHPMLAKSIDRMRKGKVYRTPGYDGIYGSTKMFDEEELLKAAKPQLNLF